jgi:indolepyruvate ferredoxin oxidoreductase beta subunit
MGRQGSILASHVIADAAIREHGEKYHVRVGETFGAAQRGGAVASHVRIGEHVYSPLLRKGAAHLLLALEPLEALRLGVPYLFPQGAAIINKGQQIPVDVKVGTAVYPQLKDIIAALSQLCQKVVVLDGEALAAQAGSSKVLSAVMLGAAFASGILPFSQGNMMDALIAKAPPQTVELNITAFNLGQEAYAREVGA